MESGLVFRAVTGIQIGKKEPNLPVRSLESLKSRTVFVNLCSLDSIEYNIHYTTMERQTTCLKVSFAPECNFGAIEVNC